MSSLYFFNFKLSHAIPKYSRYGLAMRVALSSQPGEGVALLCKYQLMVDHSDDETLNRPALDIV